MLTPEALQKIDIFGDLTHEELELVLTCTSEMEFEPDTIVLKESEKSSDLYIILEGRVSVEMELPAALSKGDIERLSILKAGQVFGEIAFIEGTPRSAQIRSIDDVNVIIINAVNIHKVFEKHHFLGYKVMRNLATVVCDRLKETNLMWRNIITNSMR